MGFFSLVHFLVGEIDIVIEREYRIVSDDTANACFNWKREMTGRRKFSQSVLDILFQLMKLSYVKIRNDTYKLVATIAHTYGTDRTVLPENGSKAAVRHLPVSYPAVWVII